MKTVRHSPSCPWRRGGECLCGGNPRVYVPPAPLTICSVCTDEPCSCERYADAAETRP